ncbi:hypothetical protein IJG29_02630 [Candidatus Saccharibacteria bacterium]|nr:hypothetical protein [Candidatus Saccharibacteria bacterium]MBQ3445597.1 hypothetical protein [Candidatus Saccharibacteria bacterium]
MDVYKDLEKTLKYHAKSLKIPDGAAEDFIDETIKAVKKSLAKKSIITSQDLKRAAVRELKKYHKDFAYVLEMYDIII